MDEEFVGEVGGQRVHDGACWYLPFQEEDRPEEVVR